jgi:hypothetical protein
MLAAVLARHGLGVDLAHAIARVPDNWLGS